MPAVSRLDFHFLWQRGNTHKAAEKYSLRIRASLQRCPDCPALTSGPHASTQHTANRLPFSLIVVTLCAMQNSSHLIARQCPEWS